MTVLICDWFTEPDVINKDRARGAAVFLLPIWRLDDEKVYSFEPHRARNARPALR